MSLLVGERSQLLFFSSLLFSFLLCHLNLCLVCCSLICDLQRVWVLRKAKSTFEDMRNKYASKDGSGMFLLWSLAGDHHAQVLNLENA